VRIQKPSSEFRKKCISLCLKALAWSIGGSKADLLELKVAAWATEDIWLEVQCIPQQMHELRPFPVTDHQKVLQNRFFVRCDVGACRARCCALSLAPRPCHRGIGKVDSARVSQLKLRGHATEPAQKPLIKIMIEVRNHSKGGSLCCQGVVVDHVTGVFSRSARHQQTCNHASKQAARRKNFHNALK
jgi:hypothetical protein